MSKHTNETISDIAKTIYDQFGGAAAFYMIGAKNHVCGEDKSGNVYLRFHLMRNATKANVCRITLDEATDTYTVEFMKIPREPSVEKMISMSADEYAAACAPKTMRRIEGVYCDTLRGTFEIETGLTLTMPRVVGINA